MRFAKTSANHDTWTSAISTDSDTAISWHFEALHHPARWGRSLKMGTCHSPTLFPNFWHKISDDWGRLSKNEYPFHHFGTKTSLHAKYGAKPPLQVRDVSLLVYKSSGSIFFLFSIFLTSSVLYIFVSKTEKRFFGESSVTTTCLNETATDSLTLIRWSSDLECIFYESILHLQ